MFLVVGEHRMQEYSKCHAYQTLLNLHIIKNVTLLLFIQTLVSSPCKFGACQKSEPAGRMGDFEKFSTFSAKSPLLPGILHRSRLIWLNSPDIFGILFMKTFCNVVNSIIYCAREARGSSGILNKCNLSCKIVKNWNYRFK